jgi:hypothetical protein
VWGPEEVNKETDETPGRFCKKQIKVLRSAVNGVAELELGRNSRRGKVLCTTVMYWIRITHMDTSDLIREYYKWQINNLKAEGWARKLKAKLYKLGLTYIWQGQQENNITRIRSILK